MPLIENLTNNEGLETFLVKLAMYLGGDPTAFYSVLSFVRRFSRANLPVCTVAMVLYNDAGMLLSVT